MGLADCPECWETPCSCGNYFKDFSDEDFDEYINDIRAGRQRYIDEKSKKGPIILEFKDEKEMDIFVGKYPFKCKKCGHIHCNNESHSYGPVYQLWLQQELEKVEKWTNYNG